MAAPIIPTKPSQAPRSATATGTFTAKALMGASGVFSSEQLSPDANSFPVIYEAAILYAADHYDAARETLKEHMRTEEGKSSIRTWLMLFDLFQLTHNRREFDALSMMFTVQFERSPPAWTAETSNTDPRRKEKRDRKDLFLMTPDANGALLAEIDRLEAFAREIGTCRVEFNKVRKIQAAEAELFSIVLQRLRRAKILVWFNGLDDFVALLKASINEVNGSLISASQGWWALLFELTILDGRAEEYEELGLEYAVAFEISPPPWEVVIRPTGVAENAPGAAPDTSASQTGNAQVGFPLNGVVGQNSREMLQQLSIFAASKPEVLVDMSGLLRIDFAAAGQFFEAIRAIQLSQKRVILSNLNELVAALLEVFGMSKHAILMRKKFV
ncbi:MAG: STAS domain-containing protein [Burkholderiales bacterium]|nr:STAS domain-containing protein [Burkholderiales bacterium]